MTDNLHEIARHAIEAMYPQALHVSEVLDQSDGAAAAVDFRELADCAQTMVGAAAEGDRECAAVLFTFALGALLRIQAENEARQHG